MRLLLLTFLQVSIMSTDNDKEVEGGEKGNESFVLKAIQQQFERMNLVFGLGIEWIGKMRP